MNLKLASGRDTRWVGRYCTAIACFGCVTLGTGIAYGLTIGLGYAIKQTKPDALFVASEFVTAIQLVVYGFLAAALADFLAYVAGLLPDMAAIKPYRKTWALRHAHIGLYLLAVLGLLNGVLVRYFVYYDAQIAKQFSFPWTFIFVDVAALVKAAVLVAVGLVLRRALPIIEESRTLV